MKNNEIYFKFNIKILIFYAKYSVFCKSNGSIQSNLHKMLTLPSTSLCHLKAFGDRENCSLNSEYIATEESQNTFFVYVILRRRLESGVQSISFITKWCLLKKTLISKGNPGKSWNVFSCACRYNYRPGSY